MGHKIFDIKKLPMDFGRLTYIMYGLFTGLKRVKCPGFVMPSGGAVIVANHMGFSDPHTVGATFPLRRVHFMTAKEVMGTGLRNFGLTLMGCIPVDRGIPDLKCIKTCTDILKNGYTVAVFPQGGIVSSDKVDAIKSGAVLISCMAKVPVIPMYICPKKGFFKRKKVYIGLPMDFSASSAGKRPTNSEITSFTLALQGKMAELESMAKENTEK